MIATKNLIESRLQDHIERSTDHPRLKEALHHAIKGSGKFIRPHLVLTFAQSTDQNAIDLACAVEIIHSYSLIHDDLPCMDNADLRRGLPSVWKAFDEATAVLAGDAMIPLAYEILANLDLPADTKIKIITEFSQAIGGQGLVAGQMMDLFPSENLKEIERMQLLKTGALLSYSCVAGAILSKTSLEIAQEFGAKLGLIYQITDDLLSACGTVEQTGKPVQNDENKITFISVFGVEGTKHLAQDLSNDLTSLAHKTMIAPRLNEIVDFVLGRTH